MTQDSVESKALRQRREELGLPAAVPVWALALSGGGIRSATFALGALQAVAETARDETVAGSKVPGFTASMLSRFDYLSTVSGGGYVGAFLCSLFKAGRLRQGSNKAGAAQDAVDVLCSGPPGRIRAERSFDLLQAPLAWLRDNGRYLVPTGTGDALYAAALGVRGWLSLNIVVGTLLVALFAAIALVRQVLAGACPCVDGVEALLLEMSGGHVGPLAVAGLWPSSLLLLGVLLLFAWTLPIGTAYWLVYPDVDGENGVLNRAVRGALAVVFVLVAIIWLEPVTSDGGLNWQAWSASVEWSRRMVFEVGLIYIVVAAFVAYVPVALSERQAGPRRTRLTRHLSTSFTAVGVVLALGVIETLGQSLYLALVVGNYPAAAGAASVAGALVWLVRKGVGLLSSQKKDGWLAKLPLTTIAGIAGVLIFVLVAALWVMAVDALIWLGEAPPAGRFFETDTRTLLFGVVACMSAFALLVGQSPGFLNLSSLQSFYSSRLMRAYLGASNGERFADDSPNGATDEERRQARSSRLSVSEPLPSDKLELSDFWADGRLTTHAPLHIINVTINKTVDPAEQLVQRDRKGLPLAVLPMGFAVDSIDVAPFAAPKRRSEINMPLNIGQWIGTSGAAFSTGIGRETSLGMSLLMGVANVRLGVWWESGRANEKVEFRLRNVVRGIGALFRTQAYLSYEFRARFFGLARRWQYLSDGGHFENTGLYELLRPERRVELIFACDSGADPDYRFDDLANLIRLARIDLRTDVSVEKRVANWPGLRGVFGTPEQFRPAARLSGKTDEAPNPHAVLLKACRREDPSSVTWIVLLKPAMRPDVPADVRQYVANHLLFPQEPTTDQFFDEAQWESYRALGHATAARVLERQVWADLQTFIRNDGVLQT
jgi:hypothetical protein